MTFSLRSALSSLSFTLAHGVGAGMAIARTLEMAVPASHKASVEHGGRARNGKSSARPASRARNRDGEWTETPKRALVAIKDTGWANESRGGLLHKQLNFEDFKPIGWPRRLHVVSNPEFTLSFSPAQRRG